MGKAKDIIIKPIAAKDANKIIKQLHYSGKVCQNSQIHFGIFLNDKCGGAMQFGPSLDKRKLMPLVQGTLWNEFMELNRLAFADWLPRNSESRAISIAMRIFRKHYPQVKWIVSYADGCLCGDGTIYRASGFSLTAIKKNSQTFALPRSENVPIEKLRANGLSELEIDSLKGWLEEITPRRGRGNYPYVHVMSLQGGVRPSQLLANVKRIMRKVSGGATSSKGLFDLLGATVLEGYQLRYIYFLDPSYRERLTVPEIPYSKIDEMGIGMYKGKKRTADGSTSIPIEASGSTPTRPLQQKGIAEIEGQKIHVC